MLHKSIIMLVECKLKPTVGWGGAGGGGAGGWNCKRSGRIHEHSIKRSVTN